MVTTKVIQEQVKPTSHSHMVACTLKKRRIEENGDGTSRDNSRVVDGEIKDSCTKPEISSKKSGIDHYSNEKSNLVKTDAMRSSLWEIDNPPSLPHTCFKNDLTVRNKMTEVAVKDFSSGSYAKIFRAEIGRRVKQVPLALYKATPSSLSSESNFAGKTFKYRENDKLFTTVLTKIVEN